MMTTRFFPPARLLIGSLLLFTATWGGASAQTYNDLEDDSLFGDLSQYNSGITYSTDPINNYPIQPVACGPVSFINGLTYLYNESDGQAFAHSPDTYADVNKIAQYMMTTYTPTYNPRTFSYDYSGGTTYYNAALGSISYSLPGNFNPAANYRVSGQFIIPEGAGAGLGANFNSTLPTLSYLDSALQANSAVELWLTWGSFNSNNVFTASGGAHLVDLYSMKVTNGAGKLGIIDPQSAAETYNDPDAIAETFTATVNTVTVGGNNYLTVTYPSIETSGGPSEQETGLPNEVAAPNGEMALISADFVESVPEPSTWLPAGCGLLGVAAMACRAGRRFAGQP